MHGLRGDCRDDRLVDLQIPLRGEHSQLSISFNLGLHGRGLLGIFGRERSGITYAGGDSALLVVTLYTVFHYLAFTVVGVIAAAIVRAGEREPTVLAGALILFVATRPAGVCVNEVTISPTMNRMYGL